ncbi:hypothetical protein DPMN_106848 [Dreissena polymorpha]|uniref:Uncharacterized protein n=1 Tax=Dreissena polymorpha TaxID=45954 RepID=A0A9D4QJA2_DREPO|nr:hypothetical protein DPMN_106848 [Dreissena polymorpha]
MPKRAGLRKKPCLTQLRISKASTSLQTIQCFSCRLEMTRSLSGVLGAATLCKDVEVSLLLDTAETLLSSL